MRALLIAGGAAVVLLFLLAPAASAWVTGPCDGSVAIDGRTYGPANDTPANPIVVPAQEGLVAEWQGSTGTTVIRNHSGWVGVAIGPAIISPPDWHWSGENAGGETSAAGSTSLDAAWELLPVDLVGLYEVQAAHAGEGGSCAGMAMVRLEGNPLGTPVGAAAAAGTLLSAAGVVVAARGRKP